MAPSTRTTDAASTVATDDQLHGRSREMSWYNKEVPNLSPQVRELFEKYARIPPHDVEDHVYQLVSFLSCLNAVSFD